MIWEHKALNDYFSCKKWIFNDTLNTIISRSRGSFESSFLLYESRQRLIENMTNLLSIIYDAGMEKESEGKCDRTAKWMGAVTINLV